MKAMLEQLPYHQDALVVMGPGLRRDDDVAAFAVRYNISGLNSLR